MQCGIAQKFSGYLSHFENVWCGKIVCFMFQGRTKMVCLLSVYGKVHAKYNKGGIEMLVSMYRCVMTSHPFLKYT